MKNLQDIAHQIELSRIERGLNLLEAEYQELLTYQVRINEHDENTLNAILADAERRIDAARRGLSAAQRLKDPAERKQHVSRMMGHLNRTRSLLDRVVKEFFPEKIDDREQAPRTDNEEYVSPQQAAETLGIPTSKLQSLVMSNKLKMYNHGGKWALKGSEVQALADGGGGTQPKSNASPSGFGRADFSQYVK